MSLSYDATRLLFSWIDLSEKDKDSFHVYEIGIDGSGLRQLTEGRFHDVSPVYLPDGKIGFVSTRVQSFSMCQDAAASHVASDEGYGTFLLSDVYRGLTGVPRGSVKQLRVMTQVPKPTNNRGARAYFMGHDNLVQRQFVQFFYLTPSQEETGDFLPLTTGSRVSRLVELIHEQHGGVEMDSTSRQRIYAWIEANIPYYGTYEHTRPGTSGSRDAWAGAWSGQLAEKFGARCGACHDKLDLIANRHSTWINLTSPELSRLLAAPLAQSAGGLGLCQAKDDKQPRGFVDTTDPHYQAMLGLIRQGHQNLYEKPRMDMADAQPAPYPQDFGHLFRGGGR